jgi:hypothetical protein
VRQAIERNRDKFEEFWFLLKDKVFPILQTIFGFMLDVGAKAASAIIDAFGAIVGAITPVLNFIIDAINLVIRGLNLVRGQDIQQIGKIGAAGAASSGYQTRANVSGGSAAQEEGFVKNYKAALASVGGSAGPGAGVLGATSATDLVKRLTNVNDAFTALTFQVATGGISDAAAKKQFNKLTTEFATLEAQGNALVSQQPAGSPFGQAGGNTTNIYVSGAVVDPEGLNRVITDIQTQSASRGTVYTPFVP